MMFTKYLKAKRIKKMSQRELARRIGVDHSYISKIENGVEPPPSEETLVRIAKELNIDAETLILQANKVPSSFESLIIKRPEISNFLRIVRDKKIDSHVLNKINKFILSESEENSRIKSSLKENEKKYKIFFNSDNNAIFFSEVDNCGVITNIIDANRTACEKLGYTKEELLNTELKKLFHKDFLKNNPKIMHKISNCEEFSFEAICISKAGEKIIFNINSQRLNLFNKEVVITIARDITDKKRLSEERIIHNLNFQEVLENISEGIVVLDKYYKVFYVNKSFEKMLGYRENHMRQFKIKDFFCTKHIYTEDFYLSNVFNKSEYVYKENVKIKHKNGSIIPVTMSALPIKYSNTIIGTCIILEQK